jgi:hypothetical protein
MALFLVLGDTVSPQLSAGFVIDDAQYSGGVTELRRAGVALLAYSGAMDATIAAFRGLPEPKGAGDLVALLAAAGFIGGGAGSGDVVGPFGATGNAIARYDGVTGKLLQNSLVTVSNAGSIALPAGQTVDGRDVSVDGAKLDGIAPGATATPLSATTPADVAAAGAVGVSATAARGDHAHAHGNQGGGALHADATTLASGFMSAADKTATDAVVADAIRDADFAGTFAADLTRTAANTYGALRSNLGASVAPAVTDDNTAGYGVGSRWVDLLTARAWQCVDATTGAAVWLEIGGGGGSVAASVLEGFSGNRYEGVAGDLPGVDTGFLAAVLVEVQSVPPAVGQSLFTNVNFGVDGWFVGLESGLRFVAGVQVASGIQQALLPTPMSGEFAGLALVIVVLRLVPVGSDRYVELWLQGQRVVTGTAFTGSIVPGAGAPLIGAGPFGNVAAESGILGVQYLAGTLTDAQLRTHADAVFAAQDVVSPVGQGWTSWSTRRGTPGASWAPSDGSGPTFSRVGALSTVSRAGARFLAA